MKNSISSLLATIPKNWEIALEEEFEKNYFVNLLKKLNHAFETESVLPNINDIFKSLELTPLNNVKVVILGQDPYPTKTHAMGLCFSVNSDVRPLPKSLKNIFIELEDDLKFSTKSFNGNLISWAKQGVLLLNSILTTTEGIASSHKNFGWQQFTDKIIQLVSSSQEHVSFILWGEYAKSKKHLIDEKKHLILQAPHPSPLSFYRGFLGSKPFSQTNKFLEEHEILPIDFSLK